MYCPRHNHRRLTHGDVSWGAPGEAHSVVHPRTSSKNHTKLPRVVLQSLVEWLKLNLLLSCTVPFFHSPWTHTASFEKLSTMRPATGSLVGYSHPQSFDRWQDSRELSCTSRVGLVAPPPPANKGFNVRDVCGFQYQGRRHCVVRCIAYIRAKEVRVRASVRVRAGVHHSTGRGLGAF